MNEDRKAFVLPAFQFTNKEREICKRIPDCLVELHSKIPKTKTALLACMRKGICQIANAHLPTHVAIHIDYDDVQRFISAEWWKSHQGVVDLDCLPFRIMEPYVILRRTRNTPLYDECFINYGYNKVQFIDHLLYKGNKDDIIVIFRICVQCVNSWIWI